MNVKLEMLKKLKKQKSINTAEKINAKKKKQQGGLLILEMKYVNHLK